MKYKFHLSIRPKPKQRPRFNGHAYTPRETQEYENAVGMMVQTEMSKQGIKMFEKWACLEVHFVFEQPKAKKPFHNSKPDLDNLLKALQDGLEGVLFRNDAIVLSVNATKEYGVSYAIYIYAEGE